MYALTLSDITENRQNSKGKYICIYGCQLVVEYDHCKVLDDSVMTYVINVSVWNFESGERCYTVLTSLLK